MRKILYILLFISLSVGATNYTVSSSNTHTQNEAIFTTAVSGDTITIDGEVNGGDFYAGNDGVTILGINNARLNGFSVLPSPVEVSTNIWKYTGASTVSYMNIARINGNNAAIGQWPDNSTAYWVSTSDDTDNQADTLIVSGLTDSPNFDGGNIVTTVTYQPRNIGILKHSFDTIIKESETFAQTIPDKSLCVIVNHLNTLTVQDEWFFDNATGDFYVYSTYEPTSVQVPIYENLIRVNASNITIKDVDFYGCNESALWNNFGTFTRANILVDNVNVSYCGGDGIELNSNVITLQNFTTNECNGCGVSVQFAYSVNLNNFTTRNSGTLFGNLKDYVQFGGVYIAYTRGGYIEMNDFKTINSGQSGFKVSPNQFLEDSLRVYNFVVDSFSTIVRDQGGLYTYTGNTDDSWSDAKFYNGIIKNGFGGELLNPDAAEIGVGIYFDWFTVATAENITVDQSMSNCALFNSNPDFTLKDCWLNGATEAIFRYDQTVGTHPDTMNVTDNVIISDNDSSILWRMYYYEADYPTMNVDRNTYLYPSTHERDPFWNNRVGTYYTFTDWQALGFDANSTFTEYTETPEMVYNESFTESLEQYSTDYLVTTLDGTQRGLTLPDFNSRAVVLSVVYDPVVTGDKIYYKDGDNLIYDISTGNYLYEE